MRSHPLETGEVDVRILRDVVALLQPEPRAAVLVAAAASGVHLLEVFVLRCRQTEKLFASSHACSTPELPARN